MQTAEDDSLSENEENTSDLKGYLLKWVNYIHGWQVRFIVLKGNTLSYYKSSEDSDFGCRGAICLEKATIKEHEIDECRFDISVENVVWYLRADNLDDKRNWVEVLKSYRIPDDESTQLKRHGSSMSIVSTTLSTTSGNSLKQTIREKLNEIETYREILYNQIDALQKFFDACADKNGLLSSLEIDNGLRTYDFKGEAITFRETSSAVSIALNHCIEQISQKEEKFKVKLNKEIERRKKLEEELKETQEELRKAKMTPNGPDFEEEGPYSNIPEDEFFDAVETGLEKIEEVQQIRVKLKLQNQQSQIESGQIVIESIVDDFGTGNNAKYHTLWPEIDSVCVEQLKHALEGVSDDGWQIFADEGEMKMYRREEEIEGIVVDPLKSCHVVKGCTAREMCHYFFDPKYRNDWETTLEECQILEEISPDTLVFLQTHKRIWPANQRDALFWSHMRRVTSSTDENAHDAWLVCNQSTEGPNYPPANQGKCIRIHLRVILLCQTIINPEKLGNLDNLTRDDLTCKITYCSVVNPGGWIKPNLLRAVYKKEYPKFLKRFTGYVLEQSKNKSIKF
ncbi:ceramide transfer protein [Chironomus tepperi]|uniref:ceramide transfer protein n=1 Tax=Chironomus tepperi TaxID=113505 RepID=UPI00391EEF37